MAISLFAGLLRFARNDNFMKIVILSNLFPPNSRGGAEVAAKNQADKFCIQGNEVIVLTLSSLNKFCIRFCCHCEERGDEAISSKTGLPRPNASGLAMTDKKIKVYELRHRNIFNYLYIGRYSALVRFLWHIIDTFNFWLASDIKKILKEENPDLVICHNLKGLSLLTPFKIQNLCAQGAPASGGKFKIHQIMHDVSLYTPSGLIERGRENIFEHRGFLTKIYRFFTRRLFRYQEKVIFPSRWLLDFYSQNGFFNRQEKILEPNIIIFFGYQVPNGYLVPKKIGEGLLYVGQLERHKGIMLLLDAFEKLDNVKSPTLNIVGDGSLLPEIKKRAEKNLNIIVHGRISHEKLPEFYSRAKATIFPSLVYENAPMVIAESLSCGTSVIVSRLGGAPEFIREGENGATFTPGDVDDLAEKIKKYL